MGLTPEAFSDLYLVVSHRGLLNKIREMGIRFEKPLTEYELEDLTYKYMESYCPECGEVRRINAMKLQIVTGVFVKTVFENKFFIGCSECLENDYKGILSVNLLSGWWSIVGFLSTPFALIFNHFEYIRARSHKPTKVFTEHIRELYEDGKLE